MGFSWVKLFGLLVVSTTAFTVDKATKHTLRGGDIDSFLTDGAPKAKVQENAPWFHTTDEIAAEVRKVVSNCPGANLETRSASARGHSVDIDVVSMKREGTQPVNKFFILFGEHARELISAESALHFIKSLCGKTDVDATQILDNTEFKIVVNGNPGSRRKVEEGAWCLRVNPNGVDLNRNWDEHWESQAAFGGPDTNPGPEAFSEPETQIFRDLVQEFRPTTFLTIHSGTRGMYQPWAFDMKHDAGRNGLQMLRVLKNLDEKYCQCPFGAAGKEVGYSCPGTCLDWVYEKLDCKYSFAFEIYTDPSSDEDLHARWHERSERYDREMAAANSTMSLKEQAHTEVKPLNLAGLDNDLFSSHGSSFIQMKTSASAKARAHRLKRAEAGDLDDDMGCIPMFNPMTQDIYDTEVRKWSNAYVDMAKMVVDDLQNSREAVLF